VNYERIHVNHVACRKYKVLLQYTKKKVFKTTSFLGPDKLNVLNFENNIFSYWLPQKYVVWGTTSFSRIVMLQELRSLWMPLIRLISMRDWSGYWLSIWKTLVWN